MLIIKMSGYNVNSRTFIRNRYNELDGRQNIQGNFNQVSCDKLIFNSMTGNIGYFDNIYVHSITGTSLSLNGNLNLTGGNLNIYGSVNMTGGYYEYNGVPINNSFYPALNTSSFGAKAVSTWTLRSASVTNSWFSVCWSPELSLFAAVSTDGANDRVMTSSNGINWTSQTSAANNTWRSICWSRELSLFVAVSSDGIGNRVMTSSNGITWTSRTSAADNDWRSVCWSPVLGLFVAVAETGIGNRVMTSTNGINWVIRTSASDNDWKSVCWSPELYLFVAVADTGVGNRVMTSPDGINWASRTSASDNDWLSVCWSSELGIFVAVSYSGTNDRVMTSKDGINWVSQTSADDNDWGSVCWSSELRLFVAVSFTGIGNRVMTSPDGINWTSRTSAADNDWRGVCWSSELGIFVSVSTSGSGTDRVMTSSLKGRIPTSYNVFDSSFNNISELGLWNFQSFGRGAPVTKVANFTVQPGENWIIVNNGATTTVTLPTASLWTGREIMIKTIQNQLVNSASANVVPLAGSVAGTAILSNVAGRWATLVSNGTNWVIMQAN